MHLRFSILTLISIFVSSLFSNAVDLKNIQFTKTSDVHHGSDADCIFLEDDKEKQWIYKQICDNSAED